MSQHNHRDTGTGKFASSITPGAWEAGSSAIWGPLGKTIAHCPPQSREQEWKANARLIAAAPEMLEFLMSLRAAKSQSTQEARIFMDSRLDVLLNKLEGV